MVVSLVNSQIQRKAPASERRVEKDWIYRELGEHLVCSCFSYSKLVRARSRDCVSLT